MEGKNDDEQSAPDEENPEENPETFPEFCRSKPLTHALCPVASTEKGISVSIFFDRRELTLFLSVSVLSNLY